MTENPSETVKKILEANAVQRELTRSLAGDWRPSSARDLRDLRSPAVLGGKIIEVTSAMRVTNPSARASDVAAFLHV